MFRAFMDNNRLLALFIVLLLVAGLGALNTLPRAEDPRITNRVARAMTQFPGASAERVEALVSEKVENKLRKLSEIKLISSVSRPGISVVRIELQDHITDTARVWSRIRDLLGEVSQQLPEGSSEPNLDDDLGYAFTTLIALKWKGPGELDPSILGRYAEELQNRLRTIPGTDIVELYGEPQEEIRVELDPQRASQFRLSAAQVARQIGQADAKVSAGQLYNLDTQLQVELTGALDSIDRIRRVPLTTDNNGFLARVEDVASVKKTVKWPAQDIALVDQAPAVVVAARMLPKRRIDHWMADVNAELNRVKQLLPSNLTTEILFNQETYTQARLGDLVNNVLLGFGLIASVLFVTLGWRAALVVSLSLPLTVLFTLSVMNVYGLPIHQISVTGLVVALGIMVDNAIVMADSIQTRRQQGEKSIDAIMHCIGHLWVPLLGSTLTTILAFMPIVLMPGSAGEFVGGIAYSVIFALIGSYLISHTIVAGLAGRFLKTKHTSWYQSGIDLPRLANAFRSSLKLALRYPKLTVLVVLLLPLSGFYLATQLTEQFFPPSDRDMFQLELHLPTQASLAQTRDSVDQVDQILHQHDGIKKVRWFIGNPAPSFYYNMQPNHQGVQNYAQAMITAVDFQTANDLIPKLQLQLDDALPGLQILIRKLEQGPPFDAPVELRFYGPNLDTLKQLGEEARRILAQTDQVIHTRATLLPGTPKVWLKVDEEKARLSGISLTEIATQLDHVFQGVSQGSILQATESIPVRVRVGDEQRRNLTDLANLYITLPETQTPLPLSAVAQLELKPSRGAIPRRNGERVNTVQGYLRAGVLPSDVLSAYQQQLQQQGFQLPAGYRMEVGGEANERNNAVGNLLASVGIILVLLITVVVLSFNSFRMSLLVFLAAFQSIGLGLLSVFLGGFPLGFTVIIGLLGLMGLAINASIVILAELKANPDAISGEPEAIIHSVVACARHISSTTITTVGGFLPLLLSDGGMWPPFAAAIAGGTVFTTLLSFYFVPAAFKLMSRRRAFELKRVETTAPVLLRAA
ncbi:MAG: efflux RND transporter permease subunit [Motiliproteus sp.]|nr:efflux RND transporter permease subunit [Motiliproteus sp.]MCW9052772.1 efflux RND transporter permease subunit [Motiliproteus sp.]